MKKLFVLFSILGLVVSTQSNCVVTGVRIHKKNRTIVITFHDAHETQPSVEIMEREPQSYEANESMNCLLFQPEQSTVTASIENFEQLLQFLKKKLPSYKIRFAVEAPAILFDKLQERANLGEDLEELGLDRCCLFVPARDGLYNGLEQNNFSYYWFDKRDAEDVKMIIDNNGPLDKKITLNHNMVSRIHANGQNARQEISAARVADGTRQNIKKILNLDNVDQRYQPNQDVDFLALSRGASLYADAALLGDVSENIDDGTNDHDNIVVGYGGIFHTILVDQMMEKEEGSLVLRMGVTTAEEFSQFSAELPLLDPYKIVRDFFQRPKKEKLLKRSVNAGIGLCAGLVVWNRCKRDLVRNRTYA